MGRKSDRAADAARMRVIVVANAKGGCGKTTLATTLASAIAVSGARVGLADCDAQRASLNWLVRRPTQAAPIRPFDWTRRASAIRRLEAAREEGLEWLVVDAPSQIDTDDDRRSALWPIVERADVVVTPVTPSVFDHRATQRFLAHVENARSLRRGRTELVLVANRVRMRRRDGLRRDLAAFFTRCEHAPATTLGDRAAYPKLAAAGLGLFDAGDPRLEPARAQWAPLLAALGLSFPRLPLAA